MCVWNTFPPDRRFLPFSFERFTSPLPFSFSAFKFHPFGTQGSIVLTAPYLPTFPPFTFLPASVLLPNSLIAYSLIGSVASPVNRLKSFVIQFMLFDCLENSKADKFPFSTSDLLSHTGPAKCGSISADLAFSGRPRSTLPSCSSTRCWQLATIYSRKNVSDSLSSIRKKVKPLFWLLTIQEPCNVLPTAPSSFTNRN